MSVNAYISILHRGIKRYYAYPYRLIFSLSLNLLFVSVFPSHAFAGKLTASPVYISEVFLGFILIFWIEYKLWERGLKRYESLGMIFLVCVLQVINF